MSIKRARFLAMALKKSTSYGVKSELKWAPFQLHVNGPLVLLLLFPLKKKMRFKKKFGKKWSGKVLSYLPG